ncbi:hypothetical protein [Halochromatium salexigens]|uniref:hypothetical protein n=1 Tax=Halochromatium salexigens TaxID=49447 RepID=UPI00191147E2|nr:hypothetical protein [Halochromatium salexigens]
MPVKNDTQIYTLPCKCYSSKPWTKPYMDFTELTDLNAWLAKHSLDNQMENTHDHR